nr:DnaJ domain-containing protein [Deltaproteobacteria bacterium]
PLTSRPTTPPPRTGPATTRTLTPPRGSVRTAMPTATPKTSRTVTGPRARSTTRSPALQVPEVQALIADRAAHMDHGADHYALLGIAANASGDEIRKVYFDYARQLHPDRLAALNIPDELHVAHKVFAQLNTAFSILSDSKRRAEYDALLGRGGESAQREEQAKAEEMANRIFEAEESYKKGELALKRDDIETAIVELKRAVELNPDEPDFTALHAWALFCAATDKNAVARQTRATLEKSIKRSPKAINPRFYLGRVHRMLGNDKEALDLFRDLLFDKPYHAEAQAEIRAIEARLQGPKPSGGGGLFGRKR